ncbi:histone-lysine N-methyltransferase PRDM9-like protein [Labeo rohita]|uniref:Histone-lysine N-methyltransferase PRDM9-like protein n=1 Tax=Labeo rohita TaxID=84645 RepID=A0A498NS83_LABRO|nr:histone-lysine N-methyltransferase PRDM9-like protein [Labeo rohita]
MLAAVGYEPTPPKRQEPKSSALDHPATLPCRGPFSASPHPKDRENGHRSPSQRPSEFFAQAQEPSKNLLWQRHSSLKSDPKDCSGSGGIRTHAPEETGALIQRLRPLGHATLSGHDPRLTSADCEMCHQHFIDQCEVHGPPLFTCDSPTAMGIPQRTLLTLPQGLVIGRSSISSAGLGVFNQGQTVPVGMHFGPFDGEVTTKEKALDSAFSWVVYRGNNQYTYVDAERDTHSNWMKFVVCSRSETEQNLVAFQQNGRILFRCCRPISPGQEFRVWYAEEYAQGLGITWDKIWDKKCVSPDISALSTPKRSLIAAAIVGSALVKQQG